MSTTLTASEGDFKPALWTPGDWNAFFGFGTIRWKGRPLPYSIFDKLQRVSHAAIVENKRLGEVLAWIKEQQDNQPRYTRLPEGPRRSDQKAGFMKNRAERIIEAAQSAQKSVRKRRRRSDTMVCAAPFPVP